MKNLTNDEVVLLSADLSDPEIFVDAGWDGLRNDANLSLINDGNGDKPFGFISWEQLRELQEKGIVSAYNGYRGFKHRRLYQVIRRQKNP